VEDYARLASGTVTAIHVKFGLPAKLPVAVKRAIKKADQISAWLEATEIAGFSPSEADRFFGKINPEHVAGLSITLRAPSKIREDFTKRHQSLLSEMS
jgi:hypothetical protein